MPLTRNKIEILITEIVMHCQKHNPDEATRTKMVSKLVDKLLEGDDLSIPGPGDRKTLNMKQSHEVDDAKDRYECSKEDLEKAVEKVGNKFVDLDKHFGYSLSQ